MRAKNRKKIVRKMVMIRAVAGFNRKNRKKIVRKS
jgi:hypothetical protein|nr:MAG TPA: hypothetical protein [Caudoviricetes sp.]